MADIEQMEMKVNNLKEQRDKIQEDIDKHHAAITKLTEDKKKLQEQIDKIQGVQEEADGAITTSTAGDIAVPGGRGNYSPKIGMMSRKKKKRKKNESQAIDYLDKILS